MTCLLGPLPPAVVITWPTLLGSPSAGVQAGREQSGRAAGCHAGCAAACEARHRAALRGRRPAQLAGHNARLRCARHPAGRRLHCHQLSSLATRQACRLLAGTHRAPWRRLPIRRLPSHAAAAAAPSNPSRRTPHSLHACGYTQAARRAPPPLPSPAPRYGRRWQHPPVTRPSNTGSLPSRCAADSVSSLNCCCTSAVARWLLLAACRQGGRAGSGGGSAAGAPPPAFPSGCGPAARRGRPPRSPLPGPVRLGPRPPRCAPAGPPRRSRCCCACR